MFAFDTYLEQKVDNLSAWQRWRFDDVLAITSRDTSKIDGKCVGYWVSIIWTKLYFSGKLAASVSWTNFGPNLEDCQSIIDFIWNMEIMN